MSYHTLLRGRLTKEQMLQLLKERWFPIDINVTEEPRETEGGEGGMEGRTKGFDLHTARFSAVAFQAVRTLWYDLILMIKPVVFDTWGEEVRKILPEAHQTARASGCIIDLQGHHPSRALYWKPGTRWHGVAM